MNYDKYRTETIEADHTVLGGLGMKETTVASVKKVAKKVAGAAVSGTSTALEVSKVVTPVVGHIAAAGAHVALMTRDGASVSKTETHVVVLKEIQADLTKTRDLCSCDHCFEAVGYAISQKNKKIDRKLTQIMAHTTSAASPVPMPLGDALKAAQLVHTVKKERSGERGVLRNRQAGLLHTGARGVRFVELGVPVKFVGGCAVARAIIDELTGHWMRWVYADNGADAIAEKLKSR
jgi:hypothetical protein